eukprot:CAMPEP_0117435490 /NCGR_PEP_ID=MMETSP0759-20121206/510_1 /TAXON_ID=63605 /ORGANISM="Percolomonas cosmopolitus, Strain WS" /LENGTH=98 /DNA_ID=CAMNT_0005227043 /DNA_START=205 /DNA_END=501 /DNA_ORIENTATION=-
MATPNPKHITLATVAPKVLQPPKTEKKVENVQKIDHPKRVREPIFGETHDANQSGMKTKSWMKPRALKAVHARVKKQLILRATIGHTCGVNECVKEHA